MSILCEIIAKEDQETVVCSFLEKYLWLLPQRVSCMREGAEMKQEVNLCDSAEFELNNTTGSSHQLTLKSDFNVYRMLLLLF